MITMLLLLLLLIEAGIAVATQKQHDSEASP